MRAVGRDRSKRGSPGTYNRTVAHILLFSADGHFLNLDVHLKCDFRNSAGPLGTCSFDGIATYAP
jgi:hypothetical protein